MKKLDENITVAELQEFAEWYTGHYAPTGITPARRAQSIMYSMKCYQSEYEKFQKSKEKPEPLFDVLRAIREYAVWLYDNHCEDEWVESVVWKLVCSPEDYSQYQEEYLNYLAKKGV